MQPAGTIDAAMSRAVDAARPGDRVVVFGSFHTVGPALVSLGVPL
jgi:folylpolyglutamate synthase/dihydropteroate synthase